MRKRADISAQGMFQVHFQSEVKVCIMQCVISLPIEVNLEKVFRFSEMCLALKGLLVNQNLKKKR